MKKMIKTSFILYFLLLALPLAQAQNVGIHTSQPDAPLHIFSSGQVQTPGGLVLLGHSSEGHMQMDFNKLQALFGVNDTPIPLLLQQDGGNVGIGTTNPLQHLSVAGMGDQIIAIHSGSIGSNKSGIHLLRGSNALATDWNILNEGGSLKIYDGFDNFQTEGDLNLTITNSGAIGMGIEHPEQHLHIAGEGDQVVRVHSTGFGAGDAGVELIRGDPEGTDWKILNDGGVFKILNNTDNFATSGNEHMRMTGGKVGIGTTAPQTSLHVDGGPHISETGEGDLIVGNGSGLHVRYDDNDIMARNGDNPSTLHIQKFSGNLALAASSSGRVGIGLSTPQGKLHITDGTDVSLAGGGELILGSTLTHNIAMDGNEIQARNNGAASSLYMQQGGGDILMLPNESGRVGIGVSTPANLPPDYLLAIDGKMISEEVRVELSGAWPDYVFQENYSLMPLDQLEHEISLNGHLPGIPSAVTIENEGIELGDMQRRIMEKIEELTLYLIQADKEIQSLKLKNEQLEKELNTLKRIRQ